MGVELWDLHADPVGGPHGPGGHRGRGRGMCINVMCVWEWVSSCGTCMSTLSADRTDLVRVCLARRV